MFAPASVPLDEQIRRYARASPAASVVLSRHPAMPRIRSERTLVAWWAALVPPRPSSVGASADRRRTVVLTGCVPIDDRVHRFGR